MIQFTYNGVTYNVANRATIADRLKQRELLELPLEGWKQLFELVNGKADIESLREVLMAKIEKYDLVDINEFTYKGEKLWWSKNDRVGLMNLANCTYDEVPIVINDEIVIFDPTALKSLLTKLEVYANQCYVQTKKHKKAAKELSTLEDVINYDYTVGYPNKVIIE